MKLFMTTGGVILISIHGVTKRFPDGTVAVDDLTLDIPEGQTTVLVGPSGCGKTTTLRMINRMIEPTSGSILIDGKNVQSTDKSTLRRGIGYVIQHAGLLPHRSIVDNIATVPYLLGWNRKTARARAMELLELVGLPAAYAKRYPFQLSGGQQQRVGVARALCADPPIMLMDEPFSAVDPVVRKDLQDQLIDLQARLGKTVVLVTHDVDEAIKLGDRIAVMQVGGHLAQFDPPEALLAQPRDAFVESFVGADRGIRSLSFMPAADLPLRTDLVIAEGRSGTDALQVAKEAGSRWLLVVDGGRQPLGWVHADTLAERSTVDGSGLVAYGHTFVLAADSLRAALDSAVLSSSRHAVGVDDAGRVLGVVDDAVICAAIERRRGELAAAS